MSLKSPKKYDPLKICTMGEMKISRFTDSTEISYKKNMHNLRQLSETYGNFTRCRNFQRVQNLGNFRNLKVFGFQGMKKTNVANISFRLAHKIHK